MYPRRSYLFLRLLLGGFLAVGAGLSVRAQSGPAPEVPPPAIVSPGGAGEPAESDWLTARWARVLAAGDAREAANALALLQAEGLTRGVESLPAPALALIGARGGVVKLSSEERIAWARRLAPQSAAVQFAAAFAAWPLGIGKALALYVSAFGALGHDFVYTAGLVARLMVVLVLGLVLALAIFSASMLFKYGRGFLHDLSHLLPMGLPRPFAVAAAVALAGAPFVLGLGGLWVAAAWLLAVWGTLSWKERSVAAILLVILTGAGPIVRNLAGLLSAPGGRSPMAEVLRVRAGTASAKDRAVLARDAEQRSDPVVLFALAGAARQAGEEAAAEVAFRRAIAVRPGWVLAENNLALLLMDAGRFEEAEWLLKRALEQGAPDARVQFNLAYLYRKTFRLKEADQAFLAARLRDPDLVERFTRISGPRGALAITMSLGQVDLWREYLADTPGTRALAANLAAPFLGRIPLPLAAPAAGGIVLLGFLVSTWRRRWGCAARCFRCGMDVCPRCFGNEFRGGMCMPCHILYVQNARVETRARMGQDQRVMRQWAARRQAMLVASTILPGVGQILLGETARGFGLLTLACVTAYVPLWLAASGALAALGNPLAAPVLGGLLFIAAWGGILFAFVFSARDLQKRRMRPA